MRVHVCVNVCVCVLRYSAALPPSLCWKEMFVCMRGLGQTFALAAILDLE